MLLASDENDRIVMWTLQCRRLNFNAMTRGDICVPGNTHLTYRRTGLITLEVICLREIKALKIVLIVTSDHFYKLLSTDYSFVKSLTRNFKNV